MKISPKISKFLGSHSCRRYRTLISTNLRTRSWKFLRRIRARRLFDHSRLCIINTRCGTALNGEEAESVATPKSQAVLGYPGNEKRTKRSVRDRMAAEITGSRAWLDARRSSGDNAKANKLRLISKSGLPTLSSPACYYSFAAKMERVTRSAHGPRNHRASRRRLCNLPLLASPLLIAGSTFRHRYRYRDASPRNSAIQLGDTPFRREASLSVAIRPAASN